MSLWNTLAEAISRATATPFSIARHQPVGGGCINDAHRLDGGDGRRYFVKLNRAHQLAMFEAEAQGLREIEASGTMRVPTPIDTGTTAGQAYLILEYLPLGRGDSAAAAQLGRNLARMHRHQQPYFGWRRDNTIGTTTQHNSRSSHWVDFWREQRLGYQLALADQQGYGGTLQKKGAELMAALPRLFQHYNPTPSLLHGDLWSGNYAFTDTGEPVIFDPAVYFGDREADLAMTELFGGFPPAFYRAYEESWPLDRGYPQRKVLYNLYHILNHLNLFGGGYLDQAEAMLDQLLAH